MLDYAMFLGLFVILSLLIVGGIYHRLRKVKTVWNVLFCIGLFPYILLTCYSIVVALHYGSMSEFLLAIYLAVVIYWYISISALLLIFISYYNIKKNREKVKEEKGEKEK